MPSKIRRGLLISITVISLFFTLVLTSYAQTANYSYDELNRLKQVEYWDGTVVEYGYDSAGNRLTISITQDTTPPTPNPMTWATVPYQTGTSSIAMVATAGNDLATPITYNFHFSGSPTGGTGGVDSAWQPGTFYSNSGLQPNHQYGYQVKARDRVNNETGYSTPTQYAYTAIDAPTGINFGTVTSTSIQVQSTNIPSGLSRGSSGLLIENITNTSNSGWKQDNDFWTSSPLSPNRSYSFRAKARNGDSIETGFSSSAPKYTMANLPGAASFSSVTQTCIEAHCTVNGNPSGTQYFYENTSAGTNSGWVTTTYWDSCGLVCGTSYSFRVKARNGEGVETDWTDLGNQATSVCPSVTVVSPNGRESWKRGSTIVITWTYTDNPGTTAVIWLDKSHNRYKLVTSGTSIGSGGSGSYTWRIPSNTDPGSDYTIYVAIPAQNTVFDDSSDNYFSVTK